MKNEYVVEVIKGGRLTIPVQVRKELGLSEGDKLTLTLNEDGMRLLTQKEALDQARALLAEHTGDQAEMSVDDFIRSRREEAASEEDDLKQRDSETKWRIS